MECGASVRLQAAPSCSKHQLLVVSRVCCSPTEEWDPNEAAEGLVSRQEWLLWWSKAWEEAQGLGKKGISLVPDSKVSGNSSGVCEKMTKSDVKDLPVDWMIEASLRQKTGFCLGQACADCAGKAAATQTQGQQKARGKSYGQQDLWVPSHSYFLKGLFTFGRETFPLDQQICDRDFFAARVWPQTTGRIPTAWWGAWRLMAGCDRRCWWLLLWK